MRFDDRRRMEKQRIFNIIKEKRVVSWKRVLAETSHRTGLTYEKIDIMINEIIDNGEIEKEVNDEGETVLFYKGE